MDLETLSHLARLIRGRRLAALGTLRSSGGEPFVSMIAYVPEPDFGGFVLLASGLAQHTKDFLRDPRASLLIHEPDDDPARDPQTLARVSVVGQVEPVADVGIPAARRLYLERFPHAERLFTLGDFVLYRLVPDSARFVAGFGRTYNLTLADLEQAAQERFS
jgi:putative heme iron utilization protein